MIKNASPLIIYEDEQIIVCHKPAGTPTQSSHIGTSDMESLLKNHLFSSRKFHRAKSGEPYLAIIHRLDQPVEGILVFAKTPAAAKELNRQLTSQEFGKYYLAVISGIPEPQEGSLENYLVKDTRTNSSAVCTKTTPGAKLARLHYRTIETYGAPGNEKFTDSKSTDTPKHTSRNHRQTSSDSCANGIFRTPPYRRSKIWQRNHRSYEFRTIFDKTISGRTTSSLRLQANISSSQNRKRDGISDLKLHLS